MNSEDGLSIRFYQNLGKLFYAIAAADNEVRETEFSKLKQLVQNEWLAVDTIQDFSGSDAAYQIEIIFDWLHREENLNSKACYNDFVSFKNQHPKLFSKSINDLILNTGDAIAESFSGKNKSELILLAKLQIELNK